MSKILIAANWKMNKTDNEVISFLKKLTRNNNIISQLEIIIFPSFVSLITAYNLLKKTRIKLGTQNISNKEKGAYTGEVSVSMVAPFCSYVILGHSERRIYFYENYKDVNEKIKLALKFKLKPILCLGETSNERKKGLVLKVIRNQLNMAIKSLSAKDIKKIIFAYEPIWAIGTGKNDKPEDTNLISSQIKRLLINRFNLKNEEIKIIYGGSVNLNNIEEFLIKAKINGFLIGKASLDYYNFSKIINLIKKQNDKKIFKPR